MENTTRNERPPLEWRKSQHLVANVKLRCFVVIRRISCKSTKWMTNDSSQTVFLAVPWAVSSTLSRGWREFRISIELGRGETHFYRSRIRAWRGFPSSTWCDKLLGEQNLTRLGLRCAAKNVFVRVLVQSCLLQLRVSQYILYIIDFVLVIVHAL